MHTLRDALKKAGFKESAYSRDARRLQGRCLLCGDRTRNGKRYHQECLDLHRQTAMLRKAMETHD